MKKIISVLVWTFICVSISNCKKETFTKFPVPSWQIEDIGQYPASMTAVVKLSDKLTRKMGTNDQMGAFINNECRGIGELIALDSASVFFVLIHGTPSGNGNIIFKYYCAQNSYMYSSQDTLQFTIDGSYGTVDNPELLHLQALK